jgi:hypothetical protein
VGENVGRESWSRGGYMPPRRSQRHLVDVQALSGRGHSLACSAGSDDDDVLSVRISSSFFIFGFASHDEGDGLAAG